MATKTLTRTQVEVLQWIIFELETEDLTKKRIEIDGSMGDCSFTVRTLNSLMRKGLIESYVLHGYNNLAVTFNPTVVVKALTKV